jgi:integrase/recombinase XerD
LRTLLRSTGDRPLHQVTPKQISAYLDGSRMSAYTWWREYQIIRSFFQFWQSRNRLVRLPMPRPQAALPPPFRPYIFSRTELLRLLMAIERTPLLDPMTMRTFLLFLYGTGARVHEAIGLCISDIDFRHSLVSLREADGGRKRMLPMGRTLRNTLDLYLQSSATQRGDADRVFVTCNGRQLRRNTLRYNFVRICARARIHREHGYSQTPGMHDLRHLRSALFGGLARTRQRLAAEAARALGLHGTCDFEIDRAISAVGPREIRQVAIESPSAAPSVLDTFDRTTKTHQTVQNRCQARR